MFMRSISPREKYRRHQWRNLFCRLEALRCVHAVEEALRRQRAEDAEVWIRALREWILRDYKPGGEGIFSVSESRPKRLEIININVRGRAR